MFRSPARITPGSITHEAVEISSGVSPEVGISTSPTMLRYTESTSASVVLTTDVMTS